MNNIFLPSDTIACVKGSWVGKTRQLEDSGVAAQITEKDIEKNFNKYVDTLKTIFEAKALVIPKTRAIDRSKIVPAKDVFVPYLAYEFVYRDLAIVDHVKDGYYAVTINGYRVSDLVDAALCNFKSDRNYAKAVVSEVMDLVGAVENEDNDSVKLHKATLRLADFFFLNPFRSFDAYLESLMDVSDKLHYNRRDSAEVIFNLTVAFNDDNIPTPSNPLEIYSICHKAQEDGLAADESDILGWKAGRRDWDSSDVAKFIDYVHDLFGFHEKKETKDEVAAQNEAPDIDVQENCEGGCCEPRDESDDPIEKIKKCVDERDNETNVSTNVAEAPKDDVVAENKADDGSEYYYSVTYTDRDGKVHRDEYTGEEAKNKIAGEATKHDSCRCKRKSEKQENKSEENGDLDEMEKRMERLERMIERLGNRDSHLSGWPYNQDYPFDRIPPGGAQWPAQWPVRRSAPWWERTDSPIDLSPIMTMFGF